MKATAGAGHSEDSPRDTCADNNGSGVETDRDDEAIRCVVLLFVLAADPLESKSKSDHVVQG